MGGGGGDGGGSEGEGAEDGSGREEGLERALCGREGASGRTNGREGGRWSSTRRRADGSRDERRGGRREGGGRTTRRMVVGGKSGRGQREFGEALNNGIHAQTQIGGGLGRPTTAAVLSPPSLSLLCLPAREWLHANGPVRRWVPRPHHLVAPTNSLMIQDRRLPERPDERARIHRPPLCTLYM